MNKQCNIDALDLTQTTEHRVLGTMWQSVEDNVVLFVQHLRKQKLMKRSRVEQVAAVYDLMGWLTSLTLPRKALLPGNIQMGRSTTKESCKVTRALNTGTNHSGSMSIKDEDAQGRATESSH
ncbi:hypothetical protein KIN20_023202 [Parelaphostrongylus tenuis]|uniref:Uncharacterized protein n=1 Tax=Parelaphostrongylus tenuis TaxID=148309 RepID=A0AAD5QV89_PARTN|nr:hypothetical protein KIN20_023202 [Parelaphostrongylus tenuis]